MRALNGAAAIGTAPLCCPHTSRAKTLRVLSGTGTVLSDRDDVLSVAPRDL